MKERAGRVFGFFIPLVAVIALTVLLIFALARLAQIQQDMRSNANANMLWVITQTQAKGLRLSAELHSLRNGGVPADTVFRTYQLLSSRLILLSDGPQARYLDTLGEAQSLTHSIQALQDLADVVPAAIRGNTQAATQLLSALDTFNTRLTSAANRSMVAQWEEMGARLDRYRNGVLIIIFLMLGISVCSFIISTSLFVALRRGREAEWTRRQAFQLQSQLDAERQISELHRNFGAMVSHQFRTPLAIIDASMQRLLRTGEQVNRDQLVYRVQKVRRATARLARLVEHTRIADQYTNLLDVELERCALWPLVNSVIQQQREITPERVIKLAPVDVNLPDAYCDRVLVEHIVFNLLSNAVKYSPADTPVCVTVRQDNEQICCTVQDWGIGVSDADFPYLFNRYFRGSTVANIQGTGIGLYVAYNLTTLQHGTIKAMSGSEGGSIFKVCFPVARVSALEQSDESNAT